VSAENNPYGSYDDYGSYKQKRDQELESEEYGSYADYTLDPNEEKREPQEEGPEEYGNYGDSTDYPDEEKRESQVLEELDTNAGIYFTQNPKFQRTLLTQPTRFRQILL